MLNTRLPLARNWKKYFRISGQTQIKTKTILKNAFTNGTFQDVKMQQFWIIYEY